MRNHFSALCVLLCVVFNFVSCRQEPETAQAFVPLFSTYKSDTTASHPGNAKNEILYGLLTPIEVSNTFNRLAVPYNNYVVNPVSNMKNYLSISKISINTGVYGVDFTYLKMFGMGQEMIDYMVTIHEMFSKLGLPDRLMSEPLRKIKDDLLVPDSIVPLMHKAFSDVDEELRKNNRSSTSGLMMMGGWVEALFIATQLVYDPANPDPAVVEKIAEQKYTLASLLSFLKNHYDDPVVVYYTKKLKYLKKYFDTFDIYFKKGDLEIDTEKNVIRASGSEMNVTVETLNNIRDYISRFREELTAP